MAATADVYISHMVKPWEGEKKTIGQCIIIGVQEEEEQEGKRKIVAITILEKVYFYEKHQWTLCPDSMEDLAF